jgi:hypothetical protein
MYALRLDDAVGIPRVGLQLRSCVSLRLCAHNEHGAALIFEWATHQNETLSDAINKAGMVIPIRLLTRALRQITLRAGG